jgi:flagellar basal-body rod modification protein FlgD
MMQTGITTNTTNATTGATSTTSTTGTASNTLDKDAFLNLLVAQLKNQDPTNTQDPNAMVQQMTSFSQLEQTQNTNTLLTTIQSQNMGIFQAQATNLVGKSVEVTSSSFQLANGKATAGIDLLGNANVTMTISDANGKVVRTLNEGTMAMGSHVVNWDGKDDSGNTLTDGSYTIGLSAKDNNGADVKAQASAYIKVDSLTFINGAVYLQAGGQQFPISSINGISA